MRSGNAIILAVSLLSCLINPAFSQSQTEVRGLQYALMRFGYYSDNVDGVYGPNTRAAVRAYASDKGFDDKFWAVATHIVTPGTITWRTSWTGKMDDSLEILLEHTLIDYESARIRDKYAFIGDDGEHFTLCVSVNAKNKFGAYTGYSTIFFPAFRVDDRIVGIDSLGPNVSETLCNFGYVLGDS